MTLAKLTRVVAAVVVIAASLAFVILFLLPENTEALFSWTIRPTMTAREMGAGYLAGMYLFAIVALGAEWRAVRVPLLGLTAFSIVTLAATVIHIDRFHQGTVPFYVWTGLYLFLAVAMFPLWLANERAHALDEDSNGVRTMVPIPIRRITLLAGVALLGLAGSLFFLPDFMAGVWPWQLSTLTARTLSAWYAVAGTSSLIFAFTPDWREWRRAFEAGLILLVALLVGVALSWSDLDMNRPLGWALIGGTALAILLTALLYSGMEQRARASALAAA